MTPLLIWMSANWFSLLQSVSIVAGLVFAATQLRDANRQRESDSLVRVFDNNRQILSLGFTHPKLFGILSDAKDSDPVLTRYYLQLWFNQFSQIHSYLKRSLFRGELKESLDRDLSDFIAMQNAQTHWQRFGQFYPASFQKYVDDILKKGEPPEGAAPMKPA
jgi:hypothetical protein